MLASPRVAERERKGEIRDKGTHEMRAEVKGGAGTGDGRLFPHFGVRDVLVPVKVRLRGWCIRGWPLSVQIRDRKRTVNSLRAPS